MVVGSFVLEIRAFVVVVVVVAPILSGILAPAAVSEDRSTQLSALSLTL